MAFVNQWLKGHILHKKAVQRQMVNANLAAPLSCYQRRLTFSASWEQKTRL
jgi:hypothetical protein